MNQQQLRFIVHREYTNIDQYIQAQSNHAMKTKTGILFKAWWKEPKIYGE